MKTEIRKNILIKRNTLSEKEKVEKSEIIKKRLFSLPLFQKAKVISAYVSFGSEVKTHTIIKDILQMGKKVGVPKTQEEKENMLMLEIINFDNDLSAGYFGILEPNEHIQKSIPIQEFDLIIVPGVAFDKFGNRLGYGKGFYDKFLKDKNKKTTLIGLAYDMQIIEKLPIQSHDMQVDIVVTEGEIIKS